MSVPREPAESGLDEAARRQTWPTRLAARYVALSSRRTLLLLLAWLILAGSAALPISRLVLRTDMAALLPDEHPAVVAVRRIQGRMRSMLYMFVALQGPSAERNRRCLELLRPGLEKLVPSHFAEVQLGPRRDVPEFIVRNRWLYAPLPELERAESLIERVLARRGHPLLVDLDDDDPEQALRSLRTQLERRAPAPAETPSRFEAQANGEHYMALVLWRQLGGIGTPGDHQAVQAVRRITEGSLASVCGSDVRLQLGGQLVNAQEEQEGVKDDLTLASALCLLLVMVAIYVHFRRLLLVALLGVPAVIAVVLSLAVASLTVGEINVNTAFLMSIILGNGINPGIVVLSQYCEERRHGRAIEPALTQSLQLTLRGTGAAMAAASIAYGCLALTSFRGFWQFGLLGGLGMFLSWASTLLLLPPLILISERIFGEASGQQMTPRPSLYHRPFRFFAVQLAQVPRLVTLGCIVITLLATALLWRYAADPLEWDFSKLRAQGTPSQRIGERLHSVGLGNLGMGYVSNYGVLRVDDEAEAEPVATALRARGNTQAGRQMIAEVRTLRSLLPDHQEEKLRVLGRLYQAIEKRRELLSEDDRRGFDSLPKPSTLRPLTVEDLPESARLAFTELSGPRGRLIGIDKTDEYSDWDGHKMLRMAELLTFDAAGKRWVVACAATVFGGMLDAILRDGPRVAGAALCGVVLMTLMLFGMRGAAPVLTALLLGIVWLGGTVALLGMKINYMNFVTLPVAIGMGTDYAANIWSRWQERNGSLDAMTEVIAETGAAVALCSLTTIIGYCSLLLAGNRALRSFGLTAALSEVCCLTAALVVLPILARYFFANEVAK